MFFKTSLLLLASMAALVAAQDAAGPQKLIQLARATDDFGLNLLHRLELAEKQSRGSTGEPKNLLISPFSISTVLSMLLAGAGNETYGEIHKTLGLDQSTLTEPEIYTSYHSLLTQIKHSFSSESDKANELQIANSVALQQKFKVIQSYLNTVTTQFDSKLFSEDFEGKPHEATESINRWVSDQTNGKIPKLFGEDLDPLTVMVLLNAVYFKGTWKYQFEEAKTANQKFSFPNHVEGEVPMMALKGGLRYAHFDDGDLLELPYENEALSMLIYLPDARWVKEYQTLAGQFSRIPEHGSLRLAARIAELRNVSVNVHLPRFKLDAQYKLKSELRNLGIKQAFSQGAADLSRIDGSKDLYLYEVAHKTAMEVNEHGAEAAAATGAVVHTKSMPMVHEFNVNRPFLFLIRDNERQVTLFAGVVNKP